MGTFILAIVLWANQVQRKNTSQNSLSVFITLHILLVAIAIVFWVRGWQSVGAIFYTTIVPLGFLGLTKLGVKWQTDVSVDLQSQTANAHNTVQKEYAVYSLEYAIKIGCIKKRLGSLNKEIVETQNGLKTIQGHTKNLLKLRARKRLPHIDGNIKQLRKLQEHFGKLYELCEHLADTTAQICNENPNTMTALQGVKEEVGEQKDRVRLLQKEGQACIKALKKLKPTPINPAPYNEQKPQRRAELNSKMRYLDKQASALWRLFDPQEQEHFWKEYDQLIEVAQRQVGVR